MHQPCPHSPGCDLSSSTAWDVIYPAFQSHFPNNPTAAGQFIILWKETAINFLKSKLNQLPEALPSPEGGAPEPLELQGLSAARYHSIHAKIQQLFKYYNSVPHLHLKFQPVHVFFSGV